MFKERFTRLCNERGESPSAVCVKVGLSNSTYSMWDENSMPRKATLLRMSDYFGVSVEYLKGETNEKNKVLTFNENFTESEKELVVAYRKHPEMHEAVHKILGIEVGKRKTGVAEIRFDNMEYYQRRWFKFTMKEHLIDFFHTDDIYESLNNALNVRTALQWIRIPEDCSLDSKISAMLTLISKTNETFFDNKLFKVRNKVEADLLKLDWNGAPFCIDRATAFVKLHYVLDDGSNHSNFPLYDDTVSNTPPSTAKIAAKGDAEVQIAKNPKTSDNL